MKNKNSICFNAVFASAYINVLLKVHKQMLFNFDKGLKGGPSSEWIVLSAFSTMSSDFFYQLSFYCTRSGSLSVTWLPVAPPHSTSSNATWAVPIYYCFGSNHHIQQYISYIMVVSFTGGGNRSIWRKPPTCHKSLTNLFTKCCIEYTSPEQDLNSQLFQTSVKLTF
jgi:hypothetical protein